MGLLDLGADTGTLDGQHLATGSGQRQQEVEQQRQAGNRTCDDRIESSCGPSQLLRSTVMDRHPVVDTGDGDRSLEEAASPLHGFEQGDGQVRTGEGQQDTWQASPAAHVAHRGSARDQHGGDRAGQQVAVPQSGDLPRSDQAMGNTDISEQLGEGRRIRQPGTEGLQPPGGGLAVKNRRLRRSG